MALTYVSTCAAGNHHAFEDSETGEMSVFTTEELQAQGLEVAAKSQERSAMMKALPPEVALDVAVAADAEALK